MMLDLDALTGRWYRDEPTLLAALEHPEIEWNGAALARRTGVSRWTLDDWVKPLRATYAPDTEKRGTGSAGSRSEPGDGRTVPDAGKEAEPADLFNANRRADRYQNELRKTRAQLKVAADQANLLEQVTKLVKPVLDEYAVPRQRPYRFKPARRRNQVAMIWECADPHWGEQVDPDHVGGVNAYSEEIAAARFEAFADRMLAWIENYQMLHGVAELRIFGMNDMISNLRHLHPEASVETAGAIIQTLDVATVMSQVICEMSPHVPLIQIDAAAGSNHGRTTKKNQNSATLLGTSWDTMVWQWVAALTKHLGNVRVIQHPGYKAMVTVLGSRWAFAHGHLMRGGGGQLGIPAYALKRMHDSTVNRSVIETRQIFRDDKLAEKVGGAIDALARIVEHTRVAHFHTEGIWRMGAGSAGFVPSLMGPNSYAIDELEKYSPAGQMIEIVHPERGIIGRHTIDVADVMEPVGTRYSWGTADGTMAAEVMAEWLDR